jgi:tetratricopeptide (TPR) repeat protein
MPIKLVLCYALLDKWDKAKEYWASAPDFITKKKRPVEVLLARQAKTFIDVIMQKKTRNADAILNAINMILMWNGFTQMPPAALNKALTSLDEAANTGEFNAVDTARVNMLRGAILHSLNKDEEAIAVLNKTLAIESELLGSEGGKQSAAVPMAYAELATIYLAFKGTDGKAAPQIDKANAAIKSAASIKGYDMYRTVQLKLHALRNLSAHLGKSSVSTGGDEGKSDEALVTDTREKLIEAHLNDETEPEETEDEHL